MRILGVDPGSAVTGFGVIERQPGGIVHVAHGTLRPRGDSLAARLGQLHRGLRDIIASHEPDVAAVEQVFVAASPRSALILGQARGAILAALAEGGLTVCEYAASQTKQAVTGSGRATKPQVQKMVQRLLALERRPASDACDALAAAVCHAQSFRLRQAGAVPRRRARGRGLRWAVKPGS
jgi:crossover junction endodeoxyribonuclease RuvC